MGRSFEACLVVNDLLATIDAIEAKAGSGIRPSLVATRDIAASKWLWQKRKTLYEEGNDHEDDQVLFPNVVKPAPQRVHRPAPIDLMALMSRREMLLWVFIAVLALTLFLLADRADAHPAYLYPEDGVMTVELAKHRSAWLRLMELEAINGPYREEVMPNEPGRQPNQSASPVHVTAPPLAPAEIRALVEAYFPAHEVETALCVSWLESKWNPDAKNPRSSAAGLWQFLRATWDHAADALNLPSYAEGGPYDPDDATRAAAWLQARGTGWLQWTVYSSC